MRRSGAEAGRSNTSSTGLLHPSHGLKSDAVGKKAPMSSRHAGTRTRQEHCRRHTPLEKFRVLPAGRDPLRWLHTKRCRAAPTQQLQTQTKLLRFRPANTKPKTKTRKVSGLSFHRNTELFFLLTTFGGRLCSLVTWEQEFSGPFRRKFWGRREGLLLTPTGAPGSFMWEPQGQGAQPLDLLWWVSEVELYEINLAVVGKVRFDSWPQRPW